MRGCSNERAVSRCSSVVGFMAHAWRMNPWFELVDNKSNWADGVSRSLDSCTFCAKHGIPIREVHVDEGWWTTLLDCVYKSSGLTGVVGVGDRV